MRTVWRVAIGIREEVKKEFTLPVGAEILAVKFERMPADVVNIWLGVDDEAPTEKRIFELIGTGHKIPDGAVYNGTTVVPERQTFGGGGYSRVVLHLYEVFA